MEILSNCWLVVNGTLTCEGRSYNVFGNAYVKRGDGYFITNTDDVSASLDGSVLPRAEWPFPLDYLARCLAVVQSGKGYRMTSDGKSVPVFGKCSETGNWLELSQLVVIDGKQVWKELTATCPETGAVCLKSDMVIVEGVYYSQEAVAYCEKCGKPYLKKNEKCPNCWVKTFQGAWVERGAQGLKEVNINGRRRWALESELEGYRKCVCCGAWVKEDSWHSDTMMCDNCEGDSISYQDDVGGIEGVISDYHENETEFEPRGEPDKKGVYKCIGVELELDGNPRSHSEQSVFNNYVAGQLASKAGLKYNDLLFEYDGSLNSGFEIITQPFTIPAFYERKNCWAKMLDYAAEMGFKSHDSGTCGLHIHVSREMFGDTEAKQDLAIAKIARFYFENWGDLLLASRRRNCCYCSRNHFRVDGKSEENFTYEDWVKAVKGKQSGCNEEGNTWTHGLSLNNKGETFEFRLGRGTLNKSSFFAWIDLHINLVKNARRKSWANAVKPYEMLKGISLDTARYLYKRGAFQKTVAELHPEAAWRPDTDERRE